jgi:eukaryotic-like serine/threonine-protein kinase
VDRTVLAERYELCERIGSGGAGTVFRARDLVLDREVAVKTMRPDADEDARVRLRDEARMAGLLAHPGIARLHDFGERDEDGTASPYLVMEYVEGRSLRDLLAGEGPMSPERTMDVVAQLADALAAAHEIGIVHRDVKPGNVLVRPDGSVCLIDFGIARSHDVEPLTLTGTIVGTVDYISPEQAGGAGATARSDLYALGLVAYECLTGVRPLRRDTQVATLLAHLNEEVPDLPRTVPGPVRDLVRRLTARDPRRRPADAATAALLARTACSPDPSASKPVALRSRARWLAVLPAAGVALVGVWLLAGQSDADRPAAAAHVAAAAPARTVRVPVARLLGRSATDATRVLDQAGLVPSVAPGSTRSATAVVTAVSPHGRVAPGTVVIVTLAVPPPTGGATSTATAAPTTVHAARPARPQPPSRPRSARPPAPHPSATGPGHGKAHGHGHGHHGRH